MWLGKSAKRSNQNRKKRYGAALEPWFGGSPEFGVVFFKTIAGFGGSPDPPEALARPDPPGASEQSKRFLSGLRWWCTGVFNRASLVGWRPSLLGCSPSTSQLSGFTKCFSMVYRSTPVVEIDPREPTSQPLRITYQVPSCSSCHIGRSLKALFGWNMANDEPSEIGDLSYWWAGLGRPACLSLCTHHGFEEWGMVNPYQLPGTPSCCLS